ncbi:hypothetical protein SAMN02745975_03741 [Geosporobacter subterraneus DSM 17957]|uniref:Uncharacterized protein n=1 Tax=Geosporobacter subterraneus DSM 17957 TaxID=1121919 RepID=A0A1M6Q1T0_9FIRM|nr:hypothetical protein [Geosporobacter subterraneus]SHK14133.1 hypothetical protein SAMN02745975_03741 [Geosporobacter subterraneus DSM 17957]
MSTKIIIAEIFQFEEEERITRLEDLIVRMILEGEDLKDRFQPEEQESDDLIKNHKGDMLHG